MRVNEVITESLDEQVLDEWSTMDSGILDALKKKGYKFLGRGVDQAAFTEPKTGYVLKIFGTQGKQGFSRDHKMFFKWYEYCSKNQDNVFLPRFYGHESFMWQSKPAYGFNAEIRPARYLMIRTEMLKSSGKLGDCVANLGSCIKRQNGVEKGLQLFDGYRLQTPLYERLGVDGVHKLAETIYDLTLGAKEHRWMWDLHHGNIMMRADGTPVINDPWVVPD